LDPSCCAALLDVARPALPVTLADRLARWDELDDEARERASVELRMMAVLMRDR
jgi:hypothetical protein